MVEKMMIKGTFLLYTSLTTIHLIVNLKFNLCLIGKKKPQRKGKDLSFIDILNEDTILSLHSSSTIIINETVELTEINYFQLISGKVICWKLRQKVHQKTEHLLYLLK